MKELIKTNTVACRLYFNPIINGGFMLFLEEIYTSFINRYLQIVEELHLFSCLLHFINVLIFYVITVTYIMIRTDWPVSGFEPGKLERMAITLHGVYSCLMMIMAVNLT